MTQTFTLDLDFTAINTKREQKNAFLEIAEPCENTLQNILNFSKNLEVKKSNLIKSIDFLRS